MREGAPSPIVKLPWGVKNVKIAWRHLWTTPYREKPFSLTIIRFKIEANFYYFVTFFIVNHFCHLFYKWKVNFALSTVHKKMRHVKNDREKETSETIFCCKESAAWLSLRPILFWIYSILRLEFNFTNILRTAFTYVSCTRSFFVRTFYVCTLLA